MKDKNKVVLVVMDGVGITDNKIGNAVLNAKTPNLDRLMRDYPNIKLNAHGTYVGLPSDDDMGNSEVGHNALGSGQIYSQGAKLVNNAIATKDMFKGDVWKDMINNLDNNTLHFLGLLSDGNVHSHINHLKELIKQAREDKVKRVALHLLQDGRDVPPQSALIYIEEIEELIEELNDDNFNCFIASGGGRMLITMDRYNADWNMVKRGWDTHVLGQAPMFNSAKEAIEHFRKENNKLSDQYMPAWVIKKDDKPIAPILDGDSVILFNFRGDRAIEISRAFEEEDFPFFDRVRVPKIKYAGILQYDGDLLIPKKYLVSPPNISNTLSEKLIENNLSSLACSETQKYGHVTYFWNGNKLEKFDDKLETWIEIESENIPFDQKPEMRAREITEVIVENMKKETYDFIRLNYPNGDMVGHTGNYDAALRAVEIVDEEIGKLIEAADKYNYVLMILADHGNSDEMLDNKGNVKTSHTLNQVPFIIYGKDIELKADKDYGLANVASTVTDLLGIDKNPIWEESLKKEQ